VAHHVLRQRGVSDGVAGVDDGRDQADGIDQQRQKDQPADEGKSVQDVRGMGPRGCCYRKDSRPAYRLTLGRALHSVCVASELLQFEPKFSACKYPSPIDNLLLPDMRVGK